MENQNNNSSGSFFSGFKGLFRRVIGDAINNNSVDQGYKTSLTEEMQNLSTPMNDKNAQERQDGVKSSEAERSTTVKEEEGLLTPHFIEDDDDGKIEPSSSSDQNALGNTSGKQHKD